MLREKKHKKKIEIFPSPFSVSKPLLVMLNFWVAAINVELEEFWGFGCFFGVLDVFLGFISLVSLAICKRYASWGCFLGFLIFFGTKNWDFWGV